MLAIVIIWSFAASGENLADRRFKMGIYIRAKPFETMFLHGLAPSTVAELGDHKRFGVDPSVSERVCAEGFIERRFPIAAKRFSLPNKYAYEVLLNSVGNDGISQTYVDLLLIGAALVQKTPIQFAGDLLSDKDRGISARGRFRANVILFEMQYRIRAGLDRDYWENDALEGLLQAGENRANELHDDDRSRVFWFLREAYARHPALFSRAGFVTVAIRHPYYADTLSEWWPKASP